MKIYTPFSPTNHYFIKVNAKEVKLGEDLKKENKLAFDIINSLRSPLFRYCPIRIPHLLSVPKII